MACLIKKGNVYSPESTVSSLLESCSLDGSNRSLKPPRSIQYKDKLYKSASQALEAYIEDFDLGRMSPEIRPGKICINRSTPKECRISKDGFKSKYGLENFKQHTVRGSVAPHLRRKFACDVDTLSLTTDDLLAFPADGSVSFTQPEVLKPAPRSGKLSRMSQTSWARPRTPSFGNKEENNFLKSSFSSLYKGSGRKMHVQHHFQKHDSGIAALSQMDQLVGQGDLASGFQKNYPRWLTSHKSDLSVSGISSIPDFKYPAWLKTHKLLPASADERFTHGPPVERSPSVRSSEKLITSKNVGRSHKSGLSEHNALQGLQDKAQRNYQPYRPRVHFAPEEALEQHMRLLKDDDTELLLLKAQRTLDSSAEELANAFKNDDSPCTVDVLEAERSWDNVPVGLKSPVPVYCEEAEEENSLQTPKASVVNGFLEDCLKNGSQESTFSGGNHHGPVEALKLMLFNLQTVQENLNPNKTAEQSEMVKKTLDKGVEFKLYDSEMIPVTKSLQRALHHLSRLKGLVEETAGKEESNDHPKT